jgi:hypothetical protein
VLCNGDRKAHGGKDKKLRGERHDPANDEVGEGFQG